MSAAGSGLREIFNIFSWLSEVKSQPTLAIADRLIYRRGECEIWSLSPDANFLHFLRTIGALVPKEGESKRRIPSISPNDALSCSGSKRTTLWCCLVRIWKSVARDLQSTHARQAWRPFKVPHPKTPMSRMKRMLEPDPFAVLTPWRRGLAAHFNPQRILLARKTLMHPRLSAPASTTNINPRTASTSTSHDVTRRGSTAEKDWFANPMEHREVRLRMSSQ